MNEYEPDAAHAVSETHRYFPEWADRPIGPETQHEADRNSYLAGGYADEFGYGTHAGRPPAIAPLDGDPECSRLWASRSGRCIRAIPSARNRLTVCSSRRMAVPGRRDRARTSFTKPSRVG